MVDENEYIGGRVDKLADAVFPGLSDKDKSVITSSFEAWWYGPHISIGFGPLLEMTMAKMHYPEYIKKDDKRTVAVLFDEIPPDCLKDAGKVLTLIPITMYL
ncbi:hypothetical protein [Bacillus sp. JCM 19041]|uniref:hypothetical protein n=1 Tax=Bacillus sp. JCM 19041 TaxID=1460637 RepID=UPI0006D16FAA